MTRQIGYKGEEIAEKYLKKHGWRIVSTNFSARGGEIDIIGYRFGVLVYFEVKTRKDDSYGKPSEAVDEGKVERIGKTAKQFLQMFSRGGKISVFYPFGIEIKRSVLKQRIDVIEVYLNGKSQQINHIKNWGSKL